MFSPRVVCGLPLYFTLVDLGVDVQRNAQAGLWVGLFHGLDQLGTVLGLSRFHIEALQVVSGV